MKAEDISNRSLPPGFRHIDWVTYGLYCLTNLASDPNSRCERITQLLSRRCSYAVEDLHATGCHQSVLSDLVSESTPLYEKWNLHKQLSAGIRHAFLTGVNVDRVTQCLDAACLHGHRAMNFYLADGSSFCLRRLLEGDAADAEIVQDGLPSQWYNLPGWRDPSLQEINDILVPV